MAVGICCALHATPLYPQMLALISPTQSVSFNHCLRPQSVMNSFLWGQPPEREVRTEPVAVELFVTSHKNTESSEGTLCSMCLKSEINVTVVYSDTALPVVNVNCMFHVSFFTLLWMSLFT
jgi:hypothetical protein